MFEEEVMVRERKPAKHGKHMNIVFLRVDHCLNLNNDVAFWGGMRDKMI